MPNDEPTGRERFPHAQLYFYVIGTVVAAPLAKSGWDALMAGDYFRGGLALAAAIVAAAGAFSFQYWESHLQEPTRKVIRELVSNRAIVAAIVLIFSAYAAVVVPDLIERLGRPGAVSAPPKVSTSPSTPTVQPLQAQPREFTDRSPSELLALYEGRTMLQADQLIEPFKGKWIEAEGKIMQLIPDSGGTTAMLSDGSRTINCRMAARWNPQLLKLSTGESLKVIGKIGPSQNGQQLYLDECDLFS